MSYKEAVAAQRRHVRDAEKRKRGLDRQKKDQEKLSALEQARLEVAAYESRIKDLLSIHKEVGDSWDWISVSTSLPPPIPKRNSFHELRARQDMTIVPISLHDEWTGRGEIERAILKDDEILKTAMQAHAEECVEWKKLTTLARRILAGESRAYTEALREFDPLTELSALGASMSFTMHGPRIVGCALAVAGSEAIPSEVRILTASGKVSVKAMPRTRFHEIYQDHVCSCMLRVAREVFALLPVDTMLLTASAFGVGAASGQNEQRPVLSAVIHRRNMVSLNFDLLDPSSVIESLVHRGDFRASRRAEAFLPIVPLSLADLVQPAVREMVLQDLLVEVKRLHSELRSAFSAGREAVLPEGEIKISE